MATGDWDIINGLVGPTGAQGPKVEPGQIDASLVEYVDILFNLMGIDITYREFQRMTIAERKQFVRNIKLGKIIENDK